MRLAAERNLVLEPRTQTWIARHHQSLATVAGERVLAELERLAAAEMGETGLILAIRLGLLPVWGGAGEAACPQLARLTPGQALSQGLTAAESSWALPLARLAACLDGEAVRRLHGSRRLQQRCERLRHWRQRLEACAPAPTDNPNPPAGPASGAPCPDPLPPVQGSRSPLPPGALEHLGEAERLALQRQLEADLPALALLLDPGDSGPLLRRWRDPEDGLLHPRSPLDGGRLQAWLALPAGPRLGRLIEHLSQERAFGRLPAALPTSPAEAEASLRAARRWWEAGDHPATSEPADGPRAGPAA